MICLLDVNALIALVDSRHVHHEAAHAWFSGVRDWATCPLTENAFVRILSHPSYPTVVATPADVTSQLEKLFARPTHHFLSEGISLADPERFDRRLIASSRQVTDIYLVGLAHAHDATLATFDTKLRHHAVVGASDDTIVHIPLT